MESHEHDVLIIGGGGAGLRAAIELGESYPQLRVAVLSKVYPMRSHTVAAEGGAAAVTKSNDSLDRHAYDTVSGSDWLGDQDVIEAFVKEAPGEMIQMEHWGCPWSREPDGHVAVRPFGGMAIPRTWFAADKTGFHMLHTLYQTALKCTSIKWYDEYFVTKILVEDGRCQGVAAIEMLTGQIYALLARSVILCTGGLGRIFAFTTNGAINTGDGMALAYQAGVPLKDMEFVQYHPTGLPGTGILMTEASRGEGGYLVNNQGRRFLEDYIPTKMELGPRDILSRAIMQEFEKGHAFQGPYGEYVHLDVRHLGERTIDEKLPFVRELTTKFVGVDPVHEPIPVRPVVHYMMGGVDTDLMGRTLLPGLYAAGETACVSMNGANRLGSNSLSECLVFGARVGKQAAEDALEGRPPDAGNPVQGLASAEEGRIFDGLLKHEQGERISTVRVEMQRSMEEHVGIYRDENSLKEACRVVEDLKGRMENVQVEDKDRVFNTDLVSALELGFMLDAAEAIAYSALDRRESRGAHFRTDYPKRDDENFLKHTLAYQGPNGPRIDYSPVTITRWKPEARVY